MPKEFIGTPEANEKARKKLSIDLTGTPDASAQDLEAVIDALYSDPNIERKQILKPTIANIPIFLDQLKNLVSRWQTSMQKIINYDLKEDAMKSTATHEINQVFMEVENTEVVLDDWAQLFDNAPRRKDWAKFRALSEAVSQTRQQIVSFVAHNF